jgi:Mn2+/Fe2+ NRAMP family transporter
VLDRFFMSKLNSLGRRNYIIGMLVTAVLVFGVAIGSGVDLDTNEGYLTIILIAIVCIVIWGVICIQLWPKSVAYCPWCKEKNPTPSEAKYTCGSCNKEFILGINAKVEKVEA